MKRLALLMVAGIVALSLTACGDNAEKKDDAKANAEVKVKVDDKGNSENPDVTVVKTPEADKTETNTNQ